MASALPRALSLLLLLAATAWAQEEASSPISLPPATAPTASLLQQDSVADSAHAPVSQPPTSSSSSSSAATAASPSADAPAVSAATHSSPPVPSETAAPSSESPAQAPAHHHHLHSATPAPAPAAADKEADKEDEKKHHNKAPAPAPGAAAANKEADKDDEKKQKQKSPAPAPAAAEMKASSGAAGNGEKPVDATGEEPHEEMKGGQKAGVVVGAFTAAAVLGLGAFVWKKRRANIRRARYAEYSARLELV